MLRIRPEQAEALRRAARWSFIVRLAGTMRRAHGRALDGLSNPQLHAFLDLGLDRATAEGITDLADVEEFVHLLVEYGSDFANTPETSWAREILDRTDRSAFERVTMLSQAATLKAGEAHHA